MSLLPPNASPLERAMEEAVQVPAVPVPIRSLWDPATCPEHLLPWLAWALSIDDWDADWPLAIRRAVVASAIAIQRRKGTIGAVRAAVAAFGGAIALREWWQTQPAQARGTFQLILSLAAFGETPTAAYVDSVVAAVTRAKPLSRQFTFVLAITMAGRIRLASVARPAIFARLTCTA